GGDPAGARLLDVRVLLPVHPGRAREARRVAARGGPGARRRPLGDAPPGDVAAGQPGHYTGYVVPTKVGDYTFHITGMVGTMNIDEKFESGPNRFGSIESTDPLQYPNKLVSNNDLAARLDQLQTLVIAGVVLAAVAL